MNACILSRLTQSHALGGMQEHLSQLEEHLLARGHRATVITTALPPDRDPAPTRPNLRTLYLSGTTHARYTGTWWTQSVAAVRELHAQDPFDVVISEDGAGWGYASRRTAESPPLVMFRHGTTLLNVYAGLVLPSPKNLAHAAVNGANWLRWARPFGRRVDRFICVSGHVRRSAIVETGVPAERVIAIPNGVDLDRFTPLAEPERERLRSSLGFEPGQFVVLWVGRVSRQKGWRQVLRAVELAHAVNCSVRLLIAGAADPGEARWLQARLRQPEVAAVVTYPGPVAPEQIHTYFQAADAFLFPRSLPEGLPYVLLQAMACGLPVVAVESPASSEVLAGGAVGALVSTCDPATDMAREVLRLAGDEQTRLRFSRLARERAEAVYSREACMEQTIDAIEQVPAA